MHSGELVGLYGRNGSGKSTLAMLCSGLLLPTSGRVNVGELDTASRDPEIQRRVGVLFQNPDQQIVGVTVEEDLAFGLENLGVPRETMKLRICEISRKLGLEGYLERSTADLSGGMRQKLALGAVMVMEPEFLLLDEPTSQLDPWARQEFWEILEKMRSELGLGILVVSPQTDDLSPLERALLIHQTRIVFDGSCPDLWSRPELSEWGIQVPEEVRLEKLLSKSNAAEYPLKKKGH